MLDRPQTNTYLCYSKHEYCSPPPRDQVVRTAFNTAKLHDPSYVEKLQSMLSAKLSSYGPLMGSPIQKWNQFRETVKETAKIVLGLKKRTHQDWFDENDSAIKELLARKKKLL